MKPINTFYIFSFFMVLFLIIGTKQIYSAFTDYKKIGEKRFTTKSSLWILFVSISLVIGWLASIIIAKDQIKVISLTSLILIVLIMETSREYFFNRFIIGNEGVYINKVYYEKSRIKGFVFGYNKKHGDVIRLAIENLPKGNYMDYVVKQDQLKTIESELTKIGLKKLKIK